MANPFQRAVTRRKWTYFLLIIGLFTLSLFWRGKLQIPFSNEARAVYMNQERRGGADKDTRPDDAPNKLAYYADWLYSRTIEQQASGEALELRELEQGDPEITSTAMRLGTLGSRGFVITALWRAAIEKFKRNEWHEFEFLVRTVTRLQPNFTTPWIYQSWNLSYNVSVENDRLNDMYFYITRGIELLAEGERMNRKSPDMRYQIGFYYQNKFSVSDKVRTLSSLFQLSLIPPEDRKPSRFRGKDSQLDMVAFGEFAKKNPQLCRRLADQLGYTRPEQIVQFLEDNQSVPTRFDKTKNDRLFPPEQQFPALPLKLPTTGAVGALASQFRYTPTTPPDEMNDTFDAFLAAGAWYAYAMEPLPPTPASGLPEYSPKLEGVDRFRYRIPKSPMLILFRQSPPRAQSYRAERLTKEGWFDATTKWFPDKRVDSEAERWFPATPNFGLETPSNSQSEWTKSFAMWSDHARLNGLNLEAATMARLQEAARGVPDDNVLLQLDDEALRLRGFTRERVQARDTLRTYEQQRNVTNIEHFLVNSEIEKDSLNIDARRKLWDAKQADLAGNKLEAKKLYAEGINLTRQAFRKYPNYHRSRTLKGEEDLYEYQYNLTRLLQTDPDVDALAHKQGFAARAVVPAADEAILSEIIATKLASYETGVMVTMLDPRVQTRADELIQLAKTDPTVKEKYPAVALSRGDLLRQLVTEKEFKYLWTYVTDASVDEGNRWISQGTEMTMSDRLKVPGRARPTP